jgi:hypothetical protein
MDLPASGWSTERNPPSWTVPVGHSLAEYAANYTAFQSNLMGSGLLRNITTYCLLLLNRIPNLFTVSFDRERALGNSKRHRI